MKEGRDYLSLEVLAHNMLLDTWSYTVVANVHGMLI